jgi:ubiquinone/menaquinone biosynthesis C-methylase UbiE
MIPFDVAAHSFDRDRAIPPTAAEAVHAALMHHFNSSAQLRILDLGAGSGRFAGSFLRASHDYVGLDLSSAMLQAFRRGHGDRAVLVQGDGQCLPFRDAVFDTVLLMHVFGGMRNWRGVLAEVRRVLKPVGALAVGHIVRPPDGIDASMNRNLGSWLRAEEASSAQYNARKEVQAWLENGSHTSTRSVAARWEVERTPRDFLERKATGAQFLGLSETLRGRALHASGEWAQSTFGSLDTVFRETHELELRTYTFT